MNKNTYGATLLACLWVLGTIVGQAHPASPHNFDPGYSHMPPGLDARLTKQARLDQAARAALNAGDYAAEEDYAQQSLDLGIGSGLSQDLLAQALKDQGKDQEALKVYKVLIVDRKDKDEDNLVPYALLLLKAGQWAQADAVYKEVMRHPDDGRQVLEASHFSTDVPQPKELAVALHIAQGIIYQGSVGWGNHLRREEGMREFAQALRLAPDAPLTNYYYGYGWQHLDSKSRTRIADAARAKAALKKAAASEDNEVKKSATEALKGIE